MIGLIVILAMVGVAAYFLNRPEVTIAPLFKLAINCILVIVVLLYILQAFGLWHGAPKL